MGVAAAERARAGCALADTAEEYERLRATADRSLAPRAL
jgi:hypothetical protein